MEKVFTPGITVIYMMDIGNRMKWMAKVHLHLKMASNIKEILKTVNIMDLVLLLGQMVVNIQGNG